MEDGREEVAMLQVKLKETKEELRGSLQVPECVARPSSARYEEEHQVAEAMKEH